MQVSAMHVRGYYTCSIMSPLDCCAQGNEDVHLVCEFGSCASLMKSPLHLIPTASLIQVALISVSNTYILQQSIKIVVKWLGCLRNYFVISLHPLTARNACLCRYKRMLTESSTCGREALKGAHGQFLRQSRCPRQLPKCLTAMYPLLRYTPLVCFPKILMWPKPVKAILSLSTDDNVLRAVQTKDDCK